MCIPSLYMSPCHVCPLFIYIFSQCISSCLFLYNSYSVYSIYLVYLSLFLHKYVFSRHICLFFYFCIVPHCVFPLLYVFCLFVYVSTPYVSFVHIYSLFVYFFSICIFYQYSFHLCIFFYQVYIYLHFIYTLLCIFLILVKSIIFNLLLKLPNLRGGRANK